MAIKDKCEAWYQCLIPNFCFVNTGSSKPVSEEKQELYTATSDFIYFSDVIIRSTNCDCRLVGLVIRNNHLLDIVDQPGLFHKRNSAVWEHYSRPIAGFTTVNDKVKKTSWWKWQNTLNNLVKDQFLRLQNLPVCRHDKEPQAVVIKSHPVNRFGRMRQFGLFCTVKWQTALTFRFTGPIVSNGNWCLDCH